MVFGEWFMSNDIKTLGIILAAGKSTRLYPSTLVTTKQLLPIYDKPLIYYPLSTLMVAGIRDFIIIVSSNELNTFAKLFENSKNELGITVTLLVQEMPVGIADAFNIVGEYLQDKIYEYDNHALILGDNIFYGAGLRGQLNEINPKVANVFLYSVQNPQEFGVAEVKDNKVISIEEKPNARGELEISDLNSFYLKHGQLDAVKLLRGMVWFDTGNADAMLEASNFIQNIQKHQNYLVGSPHEIAINNKWVSRDTIKPFIDKCSKTQYGKYLQQLIEL